jgi:hypothetical protein
LGFTRGWDWGTFLCHEQKKLKKIIKGFQSCLPTLPVYFPLLFGLFKYTKPAQCKNLVRYKKKFAYTHTQQNKKLRVIVFYCLGNGNLLLV